MSMISRADAYQRQHRWAGLPVAVLYKFVDDQGNYLAALITYYGFLSMFPLLLLAVTILGMMSLAIYRFVQANVTAMRVSSEGDAVEARYDGLRELLTQQLQSLPPGTGALAGEPLKIEGHDRDELNWVCSAGPGLLTRYATGDFQVSLRLRPHDAKSRQLDLGLLRKPKDDTAVSNEHETWVRLIDNVGTLQIRFFDSRLNTWVQRWTDTVTLPRLVKVVIGRTDASARKEITVPLARMPL